MIDVNKADVEIHRDRDTGIVRVTSTLTIRSEANLSDVPCEITELDAYFRKQIHHQIYGDLIPLIQELSYLAKFKRSASDENIADEVSSKIYALLKP
jgi:hypothetical protein